jgi:hypothetical protein
MDRGAPKLRQKMGHGPAGVERGWEAGSWSRLAPMRGPLADRLSIVAEERTLAKS